MILDDMLEDIVLKNKICSNHFENFVRAKKIIKQNFLNICSKYDNIAVISLNEDDAEEFEKTIKYTTKFSAENYYFIDENFENISKLVEQTSTFDAVCIISFYEHSYLTHLVKKYLNNLSVYDIYDWFYASNLYFNSEFYKVGEYIHDYYKEIFSDKQKFLKTDDSILKKKYHQKIIEDYIIIRDFLHAFEWIENYISIYNDCSRCKQYISFKKDIEKLISLIREKLKLRNSNDIIVQWIDALEANELEYMPFLNSKKDTALYLSNSGTVTPWTIASMWTVLMKKKAVDDHEFELEKNKINIYESNMISHLNDCGYNFYYIGGNASLIFQEPGCPKYYGRWSHTIPNNQWQLCQNMLISEKPLCVLVHNIMETHFPNICPELEAEYVTYYKNKRIANPQIKKEIVFRTACHYCDEQLNFYMSLFPNASKLYMSDHGKGELFNRWRTVTIVDQKKGIKGKYEKPFSLYNFDKMINYLLKSTPENFNELFSDYIEIQDTDIYGWSYEMLSANPISIDHLLGYRGICTKDFMFLKRNDGVKKLYHFPKKVNVINKSEYFSIAEELEKLCGTYQIDIEQYDYFKNSRLIRKAIDCYYKRIEDIKEKVEQAIIEVFNIVPESAIVAIRGGGEHTDNLLRIIDGKMQIHYIIDKNLNQINQLKKYKYLLPNEIKDLNINVIILSSYGHRIDMYKEIVKLKPSCKIIDIYKELESNGIVLNQPFYGAELIEPQDFEKAHFELMFNKTETA